MVAAALGRILGAKIGQQRHDAGLVADPHERGHDRLAHAWDLLRAQRRRERRHRLGATAERTRGASIGYRASATAQGGRCARRKVIRRRLVRRRWSGGVALNEGHGHPPFRRSPRRSPRPAG